MRRIVAFFFALCLVLSAIPGAMAVSSVSRAESISTVSSDGSCHVSMTLYLHMEQVLPNLDFPLPAEASGVTLNGTRVRTQKEGNIQYIDLSDSIAVIAGDIVLTISYVLDDVISRTANATQLSLPLLSGFSYPIESMRFSVTLPGAIEAKPAFSSGYHQSNIEKDLTYTISGSTVTGSSLKELKDHETLVMTLPVDAAMFPQQGISLPDLQVVNIAIIVCSLLTLAYYLLTMRALPRRGKARPLAPEGFTAGELGSILTFCPADISMMIFSWAQLGYLLIHFDRRGRVILHKRMDMGNERSDFEQHGFRLLFGARSSIDTSSARFQALFTKLNKTPSTVRAFLKPRSGSVRLMRAMAATSGLFAGVGLGICLGSSTLMQWLLVCLFAVLGTISSFYIQRWAYCLFVYDKKPLFVAVLHCLCTLSLSMFAGIFTIGLYVCASQLLFGLLAAYGGRRTDAGKQAFRQVLGLRRYLYQAEKAELARLCEQDPDYFYTLAPDALALGVDKAFAARLAKAKQPPCPYITTDAVMPSYASDWVLLMRKITHIMNSAQTTFTDRALAILKAIRK